MARAQDQKRWRENTPRKRVEVYLPVETLNRLDALATGSGKKRASMIAALIEQAHDTTRQQPAVQSDATSHEKPEPEVSRSFMPARPGAVELERSLSAGYRFRRPRTTTEQREYQWIVETDIGPVAGLVRKIHEPYPWRGRFLQYSIMARWAKGKTRDDVVRTMAELPQLYR